MITLEQNVSRAGTIVLIDYPIGSAVDKNDEITLQVDYLASASRPRVSAYTLLASKRVLTDASRVFDRMLTNLAWKEAQSLADKGRVHLTIDGDLYSDTAFIDMLSILHGRTVDDTRYENDAELAALATVADYWGCAGALIPYSEKVFPRGRDLARDSAGIDTAVQWVWISWVFRDRHMTVFYQATDHLIRHSEGVVDRAGLPIPQHVCDSINERRESMIQDLLKPVTDYVKEKIAKAVVLDGDDRLIRSIPMVAQSMSKEVQEYWETVHRDHVCITLIKETIRQLQTEDGLLYSLPGHPYEGCSFAELEDELAEVGWQLSRRGLGGLNSLERSLYRGLEAQNMGWMDVNRDGTVRFPPPIPQDRLDPLDRMEPQEWIEFKKWFDTQDWTKFKRGIDF